MKKKLLSTLAAVSMLTNLVTPVMAAPISHNENQHYSFASGQEGLVTEAQFLQDSYPMENGEDDDFLDELMAFVNDDLLAHELRYVEWYIENHDSNYPFSLDSTNSGKVYCGFDSGTATLTAVITRNDGSLVKASTKLVASPRTVLYANGFSFSNTSQTLYTGVESISGGDFNFGANVNSNTSGSFNRLVIQPTPTNAVFSEDQFTAIYNTIMDISDPLQLSLRTGANDAFSAGEMFISPTNVRGDTWVEWNGYRGWEKIYVDYPINGSATTSAGTGDGDAGVAYFEVEVTDESDWYTGRVVSVGGVEIEYVSTNGITLGSAEFINNLIDQMNADGRYEVTEESSNKYQYDTNVILKVEFLKGSENYDVVKTDIEKALAYIGSGYVDYAVENTVYRLVGDNTEAKAALAELGENDNTATFDYDYALLDVGNRYQYLEMNGTSYGYGSGSTSAGVVTSPQTSIENYLKDNAQNDKLGFELKTTSAGDVYVTVFDGSYEEAHNTTTGWTELNMWTSTSDTWTGDFGVSSTYSLGDFTETSSSKVFDTSGYGNTAGFYAGSKITWEQVSTQAWENGPRNYDSSTEESYSGTTGSNGLRDFTKTYATAGHDYQLQVKNFPRYLNTLPVDTTDNVSRSIRINTNVAVLPKSLHQTSSITVAVGDIMNLANHFKQTSTTNVYWKTEYDEDFFNNDSSYAYNDYAVVTEDNELLGVRTGKNKVIATTYGYSSSTGSYAVPYQAEVVATVVSRTGTSTTVTPTSSPLSVTPQTHTTTLGGAGIQLTAKYYGEDSFDVNDNVLPTTQSSSNGKIQDEVVFISNDPTVLSVNDEGFVTAVGVGTGTVTVKVPGSDFESTFTMTVIAPTIPQEDNNGSAGTDVTGPTSVPSTGINALGQLF